MHSKFILDIYDKLDLKIKYLLIDEKDRLTTFAQSLDPLYLYDAKKLKRKSSFREFAHFFHKNKVNDISFQNQI